MPGEKPGAGGGAAGRGAGCAAPWRPWPARRARQPLWGRPRSWGTATRRAPRARRTEARRGDTRT
ncbi:hypothetical protein, partial [Azospirillum argentinense]|uniref:hypothetical protein n=1 Tax=Azospirillum argentinense TaxID=2970906 RepID=UPI001B3B782A